VSPAGESLLGHLLREGAQFRCCGVFTRHLVHELTRGSQRAPGVGCQPIPPLLWKQHVAHELAAKPSGEPGQIPLLEKYRRLFASNGTGLHQFALILTADPHLAKQCLVPGLEDYCPGNSAFQEWAHEWARRVIVANALRVLSDPSTPDWSCASSGSHLTDDRSNSHACKQQLLCRIFSLEKGERFVFAMTVLEQMSDKECAELLGCIVSDIAPVRSRAIEKITELRE
jgi:DNA-directed RNA polymerase specialized sigma24 family protein